jgi:hypothetical protein
MTASSTATLIVSTRPVLPSRKSRLSPPV